MKKGINTYLCAAVAISMTVASCSNPYADQIADMDAKIAALKAEDQRTREIVETEINRLYEDILASLDDMENNVLDALEAKVSALESQILLQASSLRKAVSHCSAVTGTNIATWTAQIRETADRSTSKYEKSRAQLQYYLEWAIYHNDKVQEQRINNVLSKLDWMQENLSGIIEKTGQRMESLQGLEEKFLVINKNLPELQKRRDLMIIAIDQYEAEIQEIITAELKESALVDLGDFSNTLYGMYGQLEEMRSELLSASDDLESIYSSMPDVESALDEATDLVDLMDEMESMLGEYNPQYLESIISELEGIYDRATDCDLSIEELEDKFDYYETWASDIMEDCEYAKDLMNECINNIEETTNQIDEIISEFS